jgi:uncharacterized protein
MKIVIPGGTGQVGSLLARRFHRDAHEVVVVSRTPRRAPWRMVGWDGKRLSGWAWELDGADVLINLAGRSVNCRYDEGNRRAIRESRIESTAVLGEAVARAPRPPRVWLQASTATLYAHRYDAPNDEATGIVGGHEPGAPDTWNFSIDVARSWEKAFDDASAPRTRKIKLRSAILMTLFAGGAFDVLSGLVRRGLGGRAGDGRQYVSWVHEEDFVRAVSWLIEHENAAGIFNIAAPNPLPNAEFMRALRKAWGNPIGLPLPQPLLELGAAVLRTETELVLKSRRVVPGRLLEGGFRFRFPTWPEAAEDLCRRWRDGHPGNAHRPLSLEAAG